MNPAPNNTVARRAEDLYESGLDRPALDIIEIELKETPDQGDLLALRGKILHSQGEWLAATAALEEVSLLIALPPASQMQLADCYLHVGKQDMALLVFEHLLSLDGLPVETYIELNNHFEKAERLELALSACRKAIQVEPDCDEAYFEMAHRMSLLAYPPRQITGVLRKAVDLAPDNSRYRLALVMQLFLTKRLKEAYAILSAVELRIFNEVTCRCVAHLLLELCAWAGDEKRCARLGIVLATQCQPAPRPAAQIGAKS